MNWNEYENQTGLKRPAWIDGVGNINWSYGKKDPPKPKPLKATQTAQMMPQVYAQPVTQGLMPPPMQVQPWRPGLRGWSPGW
jgi:hypothetical protein